MKQGDVTRFLQEQLKDPAFARRYREEAPKIDLGVTIAFKPFEREMQRPPCADQ